MNTPTALLYEHEDGRYAVNPDTTGDPKWHRLGPVDVSALPAIAALRACKETCERIIDQYDDFTAGVDWRALGEAIDRGLAQPAEAKKRTVYVEACECGECGHVGINDNNNDTAACSTCGWRGPSPEKDLCAGCGRAGTMTSACPQCGARSHLLASAHIEIESAEAGAAPAERTALIAAHNAIEGLLAWDAKRNFPVPYRVRDPLREVLGAERSTLAAKNGLALAEKREGASKP